MAMKTLARALIDEYWCRGNSCFNSQKNEHRLVDKNKKLWLLKHNGHSEWGGFWHGNQYCETSWLLTYFDENSDDSINAIKYGEMGYHKDHLKVWSGRWTKKKEEQMQQLVSEYVHES